MADSYNAGSARLIVEPELSANFHERLRFLVNSRRVDATVQVEPNLAGFHQRVRNGTRKMPAVEVDITPNLTGLRNRVRTQLQGMEADVTVRADLDLTRAHAQMQAFRASIRDVHMNLDIDTGAAMTQVAALTAQVLALEALIRGMPPIPAGGGGGGAGGGAGAALSGIASGAGLAKIALVALGAVSLVPLIGQLVQAAGVVALLPAMGAAATATFATIAVGATGIKDAFEAGKEAAKNSAKESAAAAKQTEAAQRSLADAIDAVEQAEKGHTRALREVESAEKNNRRAVADAELAQKSLTQARKAATEQIEDMNLALKRSSLDEEDALLGVQESWERLVEARSSGDATPTQLRRADLAYRQQVQRLTEVREANQDLRAEVAEVNAKGVEGADQVVAAQQAVVDADDRVVDSKQAIVDAQDRVAESQRGIERALENVAVAQQNLNDTMAAGSPSLEKYNEALANLSPNARQFVEMTRGMSDAWKELRFSVQDALFDGMGQKFSELGGTYMPILTNGLTALADVLNTKLKSAMDWLMTDGVKDDISQILTNTAEALGPLLDGLGNLGSALLDLSAVGSDFLPSITGAFEEGTGNFAEMIHSMRTTIDENGKSQLHNFMQEAIDTFAQIWRIIKGIGELAGNMFAGSDEVGESWLDSIESTLDRWNEFLGTPEGREEIKKFFEDVKSIVESIMGIISTAAGLLATFRPARSSDDSEQGDAPGKVPEQLEPGQAQRAGALRQVWDGADNDGGWWGKTSRGVNSFFGYNNETDEYDGGLWNKDHGGWGGAINRGLSGVGDFVSGGAWDWIGAKDGQSPAAALWEKSINAAKDAWDGFTGAVGDKVEDTKKWFGDVSSRIGEIGSSAITGLRDGAKAKWDELCSRVSDGWNNTIRPAWETLRNEGLGGLANDFLAKITNGAVTDWKNLPSAIGSGIADIVEKHFPGFRGALDELRTFFGGIVSAIGDIWDGLKERLAGPINFVIDTVLNNGLGKAWNAVAGLLDLEPWPTIDPIGEVGGKAGGNIADRMIHRRDGGAVFGAGGPRDDKIPAWLSNGEHVWTAAEVMAAGGHGEVERMRRETLASNYRDGGRVQNKGPAKFALGGGVIFGSDTDTWMAQVIQDAFPEVTITSALRPGHSGYHGKGGAVDIDGPNKQAYADWIFQAYPQSAQLIWGPGPLLYNVGGNMITDQGQLSNQVYAGDLPGHWDHVHWANDFPQAELSDEEKKSLFERFTGAIGGAFNMVRNQTANLFELPVKGLRKMIPEFSELGMFGQIPLAVYDKLTDAALTIVRGKSATSGGGDVPYDTNSGAEQWRPLVEKLFDEKGIDRSLVDKYLYQIQRESGGNPNAINDWDINAQNGVPSKGLAQVIDPTFQSYKDPGFDDIWDPESNLRASLNYLLRDPKFGGQGVAALTGAGYDQGGVFKDKTFGFNLSGKPEVVFTDDQWRLLQQYIPAVTGQPLTTPESPSVAPALAGDPAAPVPGAAAFDPQAYMNTRLDKYGKDVGKIGQDALLEIFGLKGTPIDPNSYYRQAFEQASKATVPSAGAAPGLTAGSQYNVGTTNRPDQIYAGDGAAPVDQSTTINIQVQSVEEAFAKAKTYAAQLALQHGARWS